MKIFKYEPENRWMCAYLIKGTQNGLNMIHDIMQAGYKPAVVRLHDPMELKEVMHVNAPSGMSLLIFLCEGPKEVCKANGAGIRKYALKYKAIPLGKKPVHQWLEQRNLVCNDMDKPIYYNMGAIADTCEISAAWSEIGNIYEAVQERAKAEIPKLALVGGHASHCYVQGTNLYFQFAIMEENWENAENAYMQMITIIMEETLKRGGSIAHHHGSGKYRTRWMPEEHGSSYVLMYKLKEALDPNYIMNKGVILVDKD